MAEGDLERVTEAGQASETDTIESAVEELFGVVRSRLNSKDELRQTYLGTSAVALDNAVEAASAEQKQTEKNLEDALVAKIKNWNQNVDSMQSAAMATVHKDI